ARIGQEAVLYENLGARGRHAPVAVVLTKAARVVVLVVRRMSGNRLELGVDERGQLLVDGMDRKAERVPGGGGVRGAIAVKEDRRVDGDAVGDVARARHRLEALVPPEQLDETPPD